MPDNVVLILRRDALDRMLNMPSGEVGKHLAKRGSMVLAAARAQVGVRTGKLRSSIHMRHDRDVRGQYVKIGSPLDYALLHHEGTRRHVIVARRGQMLKFRARGRTVFTPIVNHPGTRPNKYLSDNLRLVK